MDIMGKCRMAATEEIKPEILEANRRRHRLYLSMVDVTHEHHRSHIIMHNDMWYIMEFDNICQLDRVAEMFGFKYKLREERDEVVNREVVGKYREYDIDHEIVESERSFWHLDELPEGAKPYTGLCNGSFVTCYFTNDGKTITKYLPNPNAKEVYVPLSHNEHINFRRNFGTL